MPQLLPSDVRWAAICGIVAFVVVLVLIARGMP